MGYYTHQPNQSHVQTHNAHRTDQIFLLPDIVQQ